MNTMTAFKILAPIDIRNVVRDSSLKWMVFLPLLTALIIRWGLPPLTDRLLEENGFDLTRYYPVIMSYFVVALCPMIFSTLMGFVLLDERDDDTLTALQVTPLSLNIYFAYRITLPIVLTVTLLFVMFPLAGVGVLAPSGILITAIAAAPTAPMFALFLGSVAQNKVQGFALMKLAGLPLLLPTFAFFVDSAWGYAFGIIPTYWPMKVYWMLDAGEPGIWPVVFVAVTYQLVLTWFLLHRFNVVMHR